MPLSVSGMRNMVHKLFDGEIDAREILDRAAPGRRQLGLFRRGPSGADSHERDRALTAARASGSAGGPQKSGGDGSSQKEKEGNMKKGTVLYDFVVIGWAILMLIGAAVGYAEGLKKAPASSSAPQQTASVVTEEIKAGPVEVVAAVKQMETAQAAQ